MENLVTFNGSNVLIDKGGFKVLVCMHDNFVVVHSVGVYIGDEPFISLVHKLESGNCAYVKWLYLVGKLCKKDVESKYFDNTKFEEHFNNGYIPTEKERRIIINMINNVIDTMKL